MVVLAISEKAFSQQVVDLAQVLGWRIAHFRPARTAKGWRTPVSADGAGFPDLVMVRGDRLIFAELKSEKGKAEPAQQEWLRLLEATGKAEVYLWRPSQIEEIVEILWRSEGC